MLIQKLYNFNKLDFNLEDKKKKNRQKNKNTSKSLRRRAKMVQIFHAQQTLGLERHCAVSHSLVQNFVTLQFGHVNLAKAPAPIKNIICGDINEAFSVPPALVGIIYKLRGFL